MKKNLDIIIQKNPDLQALKEKDRAEKELLKEKFKLAREHKNNEDKEISYRTLNYGGKIEKMVVNGPTKDPKRYSKIMHTFPDKLSKEDVITFWDHGRKSATIPGITKLSEEIDNQINQENDEAKFSETYKKFQKTYEEEKAKIKVLVENFNQNDYPKIIKELDGIISSSLIDTWNKLYNKTFQNYQNNSDSLSDYYNHAKSINLLQYGKEFYEEHVALREYCLKYAKEKIHMYEHPDAPVHDYKRASDFKLKDVTFKSYEPELIKTYNPYIGIYSSETQRINFNPNYFFKLPASNRALAVMHELEHTTQRDDIHSFTAEQGAEYRSVAECNCKMCLSVAAAWLKNNEPNTEKGYFSSKDFKSYANKSKSFCKAHGSHDLEPLRKAIKEGNKEQIKELDDAMGTIFDRLPSLGIPELD
ncbi:MAG: hypothetical protein ACXWL5_03075 [Candidatus Chromulinivorax sp.]